MTAAILKKVPLVGEFVDERFLNHRLRAQRAAGLTGFLVADALFVYRLLVNHFWSWDLAAVVLATAFVKIGVMAWYRFKE